MKFTFKIGIVFTAIIFALQSCAVKKYVPEGERLYTGATVEIKSDSVIQNEKKLIAVLEEALRPKPNKKFLGLRPVFNYY